MAVVVGKRNSCCLCKKVGEVKLAQCPKLEVIIA